MSNHTNDIVLKTHCYGMSVHIYAPNSTLRRTADFNIKLSNTSVVCHGKCSTCPFDAKCTELTGFIASTILSSIPEADNFPEFLL